MKRAPVAGVEEPQLELLMGDVTQTFRNFAKTSRKLERLARKSGVPVSSEGFNHLLGEQLREVNRAFEAYKKSREEMYSYIKSTYWRSKYLGASTKASIAGRERQHEASEHLLRTAS